MGLRQQGWKTDCTEEGRAEKRELKEDLNNFIFEENYLNFTLFIHPGEFFIHYETD